jgi:hypothetical protein
MGEVLGTIKFLEDRIITKKNGVEQVWKKTIVLGSQYIKHNGYNYSLITGDFIEKVEDNFEDVEDDVDNWEDEF